MIHHVLIDVRYRRLAGLLGAVIVALLTACQQNPGGSGGGGY
jgi:hypothetical protein